MIEFVRRHKIWSITLLATLLAVVYALSKYDPIQQPQLKYLALWLSLLGLSITTFRDFKKLRYWLIAIVIAAISWFFGSQDSSPRNLFLVGLFWTAVSLIIIGLLLLTIERVNESRLGSRYQVLLTPVNRINSYRRRARYFYNAIYLLSVVTIGMAASYAKWWWTVPKSETASPDSFMGIYWFMVIVQVFGVILTLVLFQEIKQDRVETPQQLFKVFYDAVVKAKNSQKPVILHHIAPFPGLFHLLDESLYIDDVEDPDDDLPLKAVGEWRRYLNVLKLSIEEFQAGSAPRLIVTMVKYWRDVDNARVYKGSCLYDFAVQNCQREIVSGRLMARAIEHVPILRAQGHVTAEGVIRFWYHSMIYKLLRVLDEGVKKGAIELYTRDVNCRVPLDSWDRKSLGFTFIATEEDAYIGLPQIRGGEFRFEGKRVDFQHEAIFHLEELVRLWQPPSRPDLGEPLVKVDPLSLNVDLEHGAIDPVSESQIQRPTAPIPN